MSETTNDQYHAHVDWDFVLETIRNEKCVLLIGKELPQLQSGESLEDALIDHLDVENNENVVNYYQNDEFFLFKNPIAKTRTYYKIKDCFRQPYYEDIYHKIAQIPFHLVLSVSPDLYLKKTFEKYKLPHHFDFYHKKRNPKEVPGPSKSQPLLYNLFGSVEEEESLILTHDDLFDFLLALFGNRDLPTDLRNTLESADNFIFLGFKFDKWYVQLLLRLLKLHNESYSFSRYASNKVLSADTIKICYDQFKIEFINNNIVEFVDTLYQKCQDKHLLKELGDADLSVSAKIENCIEQDEIDQALALLKEFFEQKEEEELGDDSRLLSSRQSRLQRKVNQGVIDENDAGIEANKIKQAVLDLCKEVKLLE
ncbi:SIR2 family protein [Rapidithrix thailandica]|uniref:SIR2 family protein n=1 Tax=Rapidithrix thailandica TaxID=413964 RepID=A0AAW9SAN8_9BACT